MTVLAALMKLVSARSSLITLLEKVGGQAPDLAPQAEEWITALNAAASPDNIAALANTVVKELGDIAKGKVKARSHPGDAI